MSPPKTTQHPSQIVTSGTLSSGSDVGCLCSRRLSFIVSVCVDGVNLCLIEISVIDLYPL